MTSHSHLHRVHYFIDCVGVVAVLAFEFLNKLVVIWVMNILKSFEHISMLHILGEMLVFRINFDVDVLFVSGHGMM